MLSSINVSLYTTNFGQLTNPQIGIEILTRPQDTGLDLEQTKPNLSFIHNLHICHMRLMYRILLLGMA